MSLDLQALKSVACALSNHQAVVEKAGISYAYTPAQEVAGNVALGDDCAAIVDPASRGHLLFAAEGMLPSFVSDDPWFAGYSAVMVNLSDIAAMGGRPIAITDVISSPNEKTLNTIWAGMRAAAHAYNVPIVGGHTTRLASDQPAGLAAAVLGRAGANLITSFDAHPGDHLAVAIDMNGAYRNDNPFWNASTTTPPERLRTDLELLPHLAERGLCKAGKDISNGGIIGTLAMLCHCSSVGVAVDIETLPIPKDTEWAKWLTSFPSYGYLLAIAPAGLSGASGLFAHTEITFATIGRFVDGSTINLKANGHCVSISL